MNLELVYSGYIFFLLTCFAFGKSSTMDTASDLKSDERIVFITTDARLSDDLRTWEIPIHAWVHEYEKAIVRKAAIATALRATYGLKTTSATEPNFDRRARLIAADNERGKHIVIELAGKTLTLPATAPHGHTIGEFQLTAELVSKYADDGKLNYTAVLQPDDDRQFSGSVNLVSREGISVISDFDDTVKITHAMDRTKMLAYALYQDYQAVAGMPQLYASWAQRGAAFHFVSSCPWQLYEPMDEFLTTNGFPPRTISLQYFRFKDATLLNLYRKGTETKPGQIQPILESYPRRRFVLVGDSGQHDPEVYAAMLKKFPQQIDRAYVRNVTGASPQDERFRELFAGIDPDKWLLFADPAQLTLPGDAPMSRDQPKPGDPTEFAPD